MARALLFVDAVGGGLAALGAGVARALGASDALAATTIAPAPALEAADVLAEVGMQAPAVEPLGAGEGRSVIFVGPGQAPDGAEEVWSDLALFAGPPKTIPGAPASDGSLERLAMARAARDRIERRLVSLLGPP